MNLMNTYKRQILFYVLLTNAGVNLVRITLSDTLGAGMHFYVGNTQI
jgi:hypothetical protein